MLAVLATLATLALLFVTLRTELLNRAAHRGRRDRREHAAARDPREALAIVGDTLAATHNPEALLPVILRATADATGAAAGRLLVAGTETAAVGLIPPGWSRSSSSSPRGVTTGRRCCSTHLPAASTPSRAGSRHGSHHRLRSRSRMRTSTMPFSGRR